LLVDAEPLPTVTHHMGRRLLAHHEAPEAEDGAGMMDGMLGAVGDAVKGATDTITDTAGSIGDAMKDAADNVSEMMTPEGEEGGASDAVDQTVTTFKAAVDNVMGTIKAVNAFVVNVSDAVTTPLEDGDEMLAGMNEAMETVENAMTDIGNNLSSLMQQPLEDASSTAAEAVAGLSESMNTFSSTISDMIATPGDDVMAGATQALETATKAMDEFATNISDILQDPSDVVEDLLSALRDAVDGVMEALNEFFSNASDTITEANKDE